MSFLVLKIIAVVVRIIFLGSKIIFSSQEGCDVHRGCRFKNYFRRFKSYLIFIVVGIISVVCQIYLRPCKKIRRKSIACASSLGHISEITDIALWCMKAVTSPRGPLFVWLRMVPPTHQQAHALWYDAPSSRKQHQVVPWFSMASAWHCIISRPALSAASRFLLVENPTRREKKRSSCWASLATESYLSQCLRELG